MNNQVSFASFFKLSSGLIALDRELDSEGCPVSYRKYLAAEWLVRNDCQNEAIFQLKTSISDMDVDAESVFSIWYNNIYGHVVYEPPASRFVAMSTPVPIIVTWSPLDLEVTMQDITLIQYELQDSLSKLLSPEGFLLVGLQKLQALPMARWVWLAMADFDISVASFELTRPAYHLSLWHSFQALEKLLKAILIAFGESPASLQKYSHNIHKLISALNNHGFSLTNCGIKIAHEISSLVGGPSVRYIDDSATRLERLDLAKRSLRVHHLLLEFFALDADQIGATLSNNSTDLALGFNSLNSDLELRQKVHMEHKKCCSHSAYSKPPYALPLRQDITYPIE
jgi:HEPN domain-containing protein